MGLLARLTRWLPVAHTDGIRLEDPASHELTATREVERILRALPLLAPAGAVLYFEGTARIMLPSIFARSSDTVDFVPPDSSRRHHANRKMVPVERAGFGIESPVSL
jgi:hypothetical protein